ncbi:hypothetical protein G7046_g2410 [Stylonectria norvegica]|nr:hypothetical protein G7046_g2410 [Stylonectria norvegica]
MDGEAPDPAEVAPEDDQRPQRPHGCGRGRRGGGRCGRGGFRHGGRFGPHHGPGFFPGARGPPFPGQGMPFDFGGLMGWANNFVGNLQQQQQQQRGQTTQNTQSDNPDAFTPPLDVFNTPSAFVLHVALPGAKKEDIGVNWDGETGVLSIAGVVHRPGDEEFLSSLSSGERKVGMFERKVTLPPAGSSERDEIDSFSITAKMEDGVLIVTVPKMEKEWTEIQKVDVE